METAQLEQAVSKILAESKPTLNTATMQYGLPTNYGYPTFNQAITPGMEFQSMGGAVSGITKVESGNLIVMAIGASLSTMIGGIFGRFFPIGNLAPIIAGLVLRMFLKSGNGRDFATGVLLGGVTSLIGGLTGGLVTGLGGLFGTSQSSANPAIAGVQF